MRCLGPDTRPPITAPKHRISLKILFLLVTLPFDFDRGWIQVDTGMLRMRRDLLHPTENAFFEKNKIGLGAGNFEVPGDFWKVNVFADGEK